MMKQRIQHGSILRNQEGLTLIETLIALTIFAVGILAMASMQTTASTSSTSALRITETATLTMDRIENVIALNYDDVLNLHGEVEAAGPYELEWTVLADSPIVNTATVIVSARRSELGRIREFQMTYFKQN